MSSIAWVSSKHTVEECRVRGVTYACPIRVALRLIVWEKEEGEEEVKQIRDIRNKTSTWAKFR